MAFFSRFRVGHHTAVTHRRVSVTVRLAIVVVENPVAGKNWSSVPDPVVNHWVLLEVALVRGTERLQLDFFLVPECVRVWVQNINGPTHRPFAIEKGSPPDRFTYGLVVER